MSNQNDPTQGGALPSVPLQPVVGRWKIAYRLLLWSWLLIPLILSYAFLCVVAWAGEKAENGKARLYSRVDKWNPYPANTEGLRTRHLVAGTVEPVVQPSESDLKM